MQQISAPREGIYERRAMLPQYSPARAVLIEDPVRCICTIGQTRHVAVLRDVQLHKLGIKDAASTQCQHGSPATSNTGSTRIPNQTVKTHRTDEDTAPDLSRRQHEGFAVHPRLANNQRKRLTGGVDSCSRRRSCPEASAADFDSASCKERHA